MKFISIFGLYLGGKPVLLYAVVEGSLASLGTWASVAGRVQGFSVYFEIKLMFEAEVTVRCLYSCCHPEPAF